MNYLLCFAGVPIGRVTLDTSESAAGFLEPLPHYDTVADVFRASGDALWKARFPRHLTQLPPEDRDAVVNAIRAVRQLALATDTGASVAVDFLDFWDATCLAEPPFVLVFWGTDTAPIPARPPRRPIGDGGARPAA